MIESDLNIWSNTWKFHKQMGFLDKFIKVEKQNSKCFCTSMQFILPISGELRIFCSISSAQGVDKSSSFKVLERKIPKNSSGKFNGQLHCLGATQTWARGNFLENGPTKILCSYANVGRTMYSTGASSSFRSWQENRLLVRKTHSQNRYEIRRTWQRSGSR